MLKHIIDILQIDEFIEESYNIQVAKGLYAMPKGIKETYKQKKREQVIKKRVKKILK